MRVTSAVFLFLLLVTAAGALLPRIGDQRAADADIISHALNLPDQTYALRDPNMVPAIARNLLLAESIQVCGLFGTDAAVALADINGVLKGQHIVNHDVFTWADSCPILGREGRVRGYPEALVLRLWGRDDLMRPPQRPAALRRRSRATREA